MAQLKDILNYLNNSGMLSTYNANEPEKSNIKNMTLFDIQNMVNYFQKSENPIDEIINKVKEADKEDKVVIWYDEDTLATYSIDKLLNQPADMLLYDLNRDDATLFTLLKAGNKWCLNSLAAARIIKYLMKNNKIFKETLLANDITTESDKTLSKKEFIEYIQKIVNEAREQCPALRYGQAVFNAVDEHFLCARDINPELDCFYNDNLVNPFLDAAYEQYLAKYDL